MNGPLIGVAVTGQGQPDPSEDVPGCCGSQCVSAFHRVFDQRSVC